MKNNDKSYNQGLKLGVAVMLMFPVTISFMLNYSYPEWMRIVGGITIWIGVILWLNITGQSTEEKIREIRKNSDSHYIPGT